MRRFKDRIIVLVLVVTGPIVVAMVVDAAIAVSQIILK
jgi:hypothetical protein